jgi:hypothetical protein
MKSGCRPIGGVDFFVSEDRPVNLPIRVRGLILCLFGFGAAAAIVSFFGGREYTAFAVGGLGALGLEGVLELVTGYPFYKIAEKWDSMPALVTLFLGMLIVAAVVGGLVLVLMSDARTALMNWLS